MADINADGIYFGLDESAYHADPALGSSDLKQIYLDPIDWQYDRLHGTREETDAMLFGSALHCRVLEGKAVFDAKFCGVPVKPDGCLITNDDLGAWLKSYGLSDKGKKAELIERIQSSGVAQPAIWEVLREEFEALNAGKSELTEQQFERVETAARWMQADATLQVMMKDGAFQFGAPEVSFFYTVEGVRLKARFDYLVGHAILDLKSFAPMYKEVPAYSITRAIMRQRYDLQCAAYVRAWHQGRKLYESGAVFGSQPDGLLKSVYSRAHPLWVWVFLKTVAAPQPFVRSLSNEEMVFGIADRCITTAIEKYQAKVAEFGTEKIWPPNNPPEAMATDDFPQWFQD